MAFLVQVSHNSSADIKSHILSSELVSSSHGFCTGQNLVGLVVCLVGGISDVSGRHCQVPPNYFETLSERVCGVLLHGCSSGIYEDRPMRAVL